MRSGAPWRDLPDSFGPYTTCYNRLVRWRRAGVWGRIMNALTTAHDASADDRDVYCACASTRCLHPPESAIVHGPVTRRADQQDSRGGRPVGLPIRLALFGRRGTRPSACRQAPLSLEVGNNAAVAMMATGSEPWPRVRARSLTFHQGATATSPQLGRAVLQQDRTVPRVATHYAHRQLPCLHPAASIRLWLRVNKSTTYSPQTTPLTALPRRAGRYRSRRETARPCRRHVPGRLGREPVFPARALASS